MASNCVLLMGTTLFTILNNILTSLLTVYRWRYEGGEDKEARQKQLHGSDEEKKKMEKPFDDRKVGGWFNQERKAVVEKLMYVAK